MFRLEILTLDAAVLDSPVVELDPMKPSFLALGTPAVIRSSLLLSRAESLAERKGVDYECDYAGAAQRDEHGILVVEV